MRQRLFQHTNLAGDNYIYQDDVTGIVDVETKLQGETEFMPNPTVIIEYEDEAPPDHPEFPNQSFITIDFNEQQISDLKFANSMHPLPEVTP